MLPLFENLGTYALEYSHLKIHHDFKIITFRKDDTKSMSLYCGWWIQDFTKFPPLSPQDFGIKTVTAESSFLSGHADFFNIAQMFLMPLLYSCHYASS